MMVIDPYRFSPSIINAGWNPADTNANLVLTNSNKTIGRANNNPGWHTGRSLARTTGKLYFEVLLTNYPGSAVSSSMAVGCCAASMPLVGDPVFSGGSLAGQRVTTRPNGQYGTETGYKGLLGGPYNFSAAGDHVFGISVDFATRVLYFYFDAAGPNGDLWGVGAPAMLPFMCFDSGAGTVVQATLRTMASEFTRGLPAGYTPWAEGS